MSASDIKSMIRHMARTNPDDLDHLLVEVEKETRLGKIMSRLGSSDRRFLADYIEDLEEASQVSFRSRTPSMPTSSPTGRHTEFEEEYTRPKLPQADPNEAMTQAMMQLFGMDSPEELTSFVDRAKAKAKVHGTPSAPEPPAPEKKAEAESSEDPRVSELRRMMANNYEQAGSTFIRRDGHKVFRGQSGWQIQDPDGNVYDGFSTPELDVAIATLEQNIPL